MGQVICGVCGSTGRQPFCSFLTQRIEDRNLDTFLFDTERGELAGNVAMLLCSLCNMDPCGL